MKRINSLVCTAAFMLILGTAVSYAQYGSGRALLAYPMNGQTLEQENVDRVACHDWAVAQTGYDPTLVYAAQQYWIKAWRRHSASALLPTPTGRFRGSHGKRREKPAE